MYDDFNIGDLVIVDNPQIIFNFSNNPADSDVGPFVDPKKGLGIVVDYNPLFLNGCLKVWWSKAGVFTQESSTTLRKLN